MVTAQELKRFQSRLRAKKRSTLSEKKAKALLEESGYDFKFQMILGFFIIDFVFPAKMLIVEVDGPYHEENKWYDKKRDIFAKRCNFQVERIKNEDVETILDIVASYPNLVDHEKKFRKGLSLANTIKGREIQRKRLNRNKTN